MIISNLGDTVINEVEIQTEVNGISSFVNFDMLDISFSEQEIITLILDENLQQSNEVIIDIFSINSRILGAATSYSILH